MPNIMLTNKCNLNCPYCFANEFVNVDANEISLQDFRTALDFVVGDGSCRHVGLIGGEPTLHSAFGDILRCVIDDNRVEGATLYTNGLRLEPFFNELAHPKFNLLVNVNPPNAIGQERYGRIVANVSHLVDERYMHDRVTLGVNMHGPAFEYEYMVDLLVRYGFDRVRVSITVPNVDAGRNVDARPYFLAIKPRVKRFFRMLLEHGITPFFDCNKIPSCLVDAEELAEFGEFLTLEEPGLHGANGLLSRAVQCKPVVDIMQDLTAVRCFGLSEHTKVRLADFDTISELVRYYENSVDAFAYQTSYAAECATCRLRASRTCTGGCLAFKVADILQLRSLADGLMAAKPSAAEPLAPTAPPAA